jgi:DNA-binding transcriptional regulator YhcF (GntR family)
VCTRVNPNGHGCATGGLAKAVLDNNSPVPLHEQLSALLREQIARRELAGRVPSILSLAQEHGVSHRTAARSLATLRDEGLIISVRGKGYYVR